MKVVVNKFFYPDQRFHTKTLGKPMTDFIEKYKEDIPDLLKKVRKKSHFIYSKMYNVSLFFSNNIEWLQFTNYQLDVILFLTPIFRK